MSYSTLGTQCRLYTFYCDTLVYRPTREQQLTYYLSVKHNGLSRWLHRYKNIEDSKSRAHATGLEPEGQFVDSEQASVLTLRLWYRQQCVCTGTCS